jgi:acyl-CoA thioesterase
VAPKLLNPHGVLHGGVLYTMADTSMGYAVYSTLDRGQSCATIEIKMVYLKPVLEGRVRCVTKLVHRGARIAVLESSLACSKILVAKALGTFAIFAARPEQRGGPGV